MRRLRTEACTASIPAEVVQFIISAWKIRLPDEPPILGGTRIEVYYSHGITLSILAGIEQCDIGEALWRSLHCHAWGRVESWIRTH
jgi:hypothetical protein